MDDSVTLELLDELTHEFLQILEKTPSRLKRIRNWRATQAAKKPKSENASLMDNSFPGSSALQDQSDSSSNQSYSKAGTAFAMSLSGQSQRASLSLDSLSATYNPASEWPQSQAGYPSGCIKQEPLNISIQEAAASSQMSVPSLLQPVIKTEKTLDFYPVKLEQKGSSGGGVGKHHPPTLSANPSAAQPPGPQSSSAQKLLLEKCREKHEAVLSGQKRRQEQHGGVMDCDRGDLSSSSFTYAPATMSQVDHRKHSQSHQTTGGATASPMKIKVPSSSASGQDRRHYSDKREKGLPKLHLGVPGGSSFGQPSKDELKMKIKVSSSDRHSSSDESMATNNKSKHSSPLVSKEKHRGSEHNLHRHHKHSHTHSGNGRGDAEGPGAAGLLRSPPGLVGMEGSSLAPPGLAPPSSSRKRGHLEVSHNHHPSSSTSCSKVSKVPKGGTGAAGGLRTSQQYPPHSDSPHEVGEQRH